MMSSANETITNERFQLLDKCTNELLNKFLDLLSSAKVPLEGQRDCRDQKEQLQMSLASSQIIHTVEQLLVLCQELRMAYIMQDYTRMDELRNIEEGRLHQSIQQLQDRISKITTMEGGI